MRGDGRDIEGGVPPPKTKLDWVLEAFKPFDRQEPTTPSLFLHFSEDVETARLCQQKGHVSRTRRDPNNYLVMLRTADLPSDAVVINLSTKKKHQGIQWPVPARGRSQVSRFLGLQACDEEQGVARLSPGRHGAAPHAPTMRWEGQACAGWVV